MSRFYASCLRALVLKDDLSLPAGFLLWLTKERRPRLSGRYVCATWDVDELLTKQDDIESRDLLKLRMRV